MQSETLGTRIRSLEKDKQLLSAMSLEKQRLNDQQAAQHTRRIQSLEAMLRSETEEHS